MTSGCGSTVCCRLPWLIVISDYEVDMVHVDGDIYELTIPNPESLSWIHTIAHTFPEVDVWRTNDWYKRHPTDPNLFTLRRRGDDMIVLSNGEKF